MAAKVSGRSWAVLGAVVVVAGLAVTGWLWLRKGDDPFAGAAPAAEAYATAWQAGDLASATFAGGTAGGDVAAQVGTITAGLAATPVGPSTVRVGAVTPDPGHPDRGTAQTAVTWDLGGGHQWSYEVSTPLVKEGRDWFVAWTPAAVEPSLVDGEILHAERDAATRGAVLDGAGAPIFLERPVVVVGIATPKDGVATPTRAQLDQTAATVAGVVGVDAATLRQRVAAAPADRFVEVITLRRERYDQLKPQIYDLPGTAFQQGTRLLGPSTGFASAVLGSVGEATAEDIERSGGSIVAGQQVGHGGVQGAYDERLSGTDGVTVTAAPAPVSGAPATDGSGGVALARVLYRAEPVAGQDVRVTLDSSLQTRAEEAVSAAPKPAAMVVVRPSTGEVLAAANGGAGDTGFGRALEGRYPPGSTFKVVSTAALLAQGLSPQETVACPATATVGGRSFVNAESHELGSVPFHVDFAESCNTAFVGLAGRVSDDQLASAAAALGLADDYGLGIPAFGGDVPPNTDAVGHAAAMIGQSKVLASPLGMSLVAASVADGSTVTPILVTDPVSRAPLLPGGPAATASGTTGSTVAGGDPSAATSTTTLASSTTMTAPSGSATRALDPAVATELQALMREVVTNGTGTVLAAVPGPPVHAKTGTAEFGTEDPPQTHAWMIGYQGDLAFAVLVEDGGFGATAAGPVAAQFLRSLG